MPQTIAAYLVSQGVNVIAANIIAYVGTTVVVNSYSQAQRRKAERKARSASNDQLRDRNVTTRGSIEARQLVLGRVRTGGKIIFIGSTGPNKEKLTLVIALASHRIAGVDEVWFNDEPLVLDGSGYVASGSYVKTSLEDATAAITITAGSGSVTLPNTPAGTVRVVVPPGTPETSEAFFNGTVAGNVASFTGVQQEASPYTGAAVVQYQYTRVQSRARVRWMLGGADQAAFADLITQFPDQWTADHRGRGVAYLVAELDYDPDVYPSGVPNISAVVRGADEVFDPRTGTSGYSQNPALLMRHYLLHPLGGRRAARQVDDQAVIAAANVCDRSVNYGAGATALYTAGMVATTEQTPASVCDELAEAMAGRWGYSSGVVRMRAGDVGTAVAHITDSWLAGGQLQVQPHRPRAELANVLRGTFIDPEGGWQAVPFTPVPQDAGEAAALRAADGGEELAQELEFGAINRRGQAQQVAAVLLREQRQGLTVTLELNMKAYSLQLFDVVSFTLARFGWEAKLFEVVGRSYTLGGAIRLVLRETGSSIYAFGTSFPAGDALPNTSLPNPRVVPQVGTVTATSGPTVLPDGSIVSRVVLAWPAVADRNVTEGGYIEVGFREAADTTGGLRAVRADSFTGHTMVGLRGGRGYMFAARAVNGLGVRGQWSAETAHVVYLVRGPRAFVGPNTPTGDVRDNDTWTDTDDGNHPYVRTGGTWVSVRDQTIATAQSAATAAAGAAAAAQSAADAANGALADIASDSVLTPDEKPRVILDRDVIVAERAGIEAQADNYAVTTEKAAYSSAVDALVAYLATLTAPTLWSDLSGKTTIVGATFRATFADVYTKRQALLDKINANAKARLGALATLNTVGTGQIAASAATEVYTVTPSSPVTVTAVESTPESAGAKTVLASVTFTPAASGEASVFAEALGDYTNSTAFAANGNYSLQQGAYDAWKRLAIDVPASSRTRSAMNTTRRFAVTSGVTYTIDFLATKLNSGDTFTVESIELRVEVIKR